MKFIKKYKNIEYWNRKFHIHLGLFLLLFIWLFAFSGLLLNHSHWKFADFYDKRKETITTSFIQMPVNRDSITLVKNIVTQLKVEGEITNVKMWADSIHLQVSFPGHVSSLQVNFKTGVCTRKELQYNWIGKIRTLHTFNGVNKNNPYQQPNWIITRIWKLSMDGIAIALLILCMSSWIMWYKVRKKFNWGLIVLISGFIGVVFFIFVLKML